MPAIGFPMPATAIKLLKDPRWRATPLYTALLQARKKTCLMSELLSRCVAQAAGTTRGQGQGWPGKCWAGGGREGKRTSGKRAKRLSLEDI